MIRLYSVTPKTVLKLSSPDVYWRTKITVRFINFFCFGYSYTGLYSRYPAVFLTRWNLFHKYNEVIQSVGENFINRRRSSWKLKKPDRYSPLSIALSGNQSCGYNPVFVLSLSGVQRGFLEYSEGHGPTKAQPTPNQPPVNSLSTENETWTKLR